jgi:fused signal recognition particle receptor
MAPFSFFSSKKKIEPQPQAEEPLDTLAQGLEKTREGIFKRLSRTIVGKSKVDDEVLDSLEETLISSDVGVDATLQVVKLIQQRVARDKVLNTAELNSILREEIASLLEDNEDSALAAPDTQGAPHVVMVIGVNGVGKTTTIGKLAAQLTAEGKKVYVGAADTFRAAAIDQLEVWAKRAGATIIKQQMGADPASVAFDTLSSAKANGADVVFIDTAGRLHNKVNLMNELSKIRNVMGKVIPGAPHEVLLVLDGSTGQNAYQQATEFSKATEVTALAITKLDGSAKGGVVIGISAQLKVPIKYIGVGEKVGDLQRFDKKKFVEALFA